MSNKIEKTAREMFEDLDWKYTFLDDDNCIAYDKYSKADDGKGWEHIATVFFDIEKKTYNVWKIKRDVYEILSLDITPEIHLAIDKQMKELELI